MTVRIFSFPQNQHENERSKSGNAKSRFLFSVNPFLRKTQLRKSRKTWNRSIFFSPGISHLSVSDSFVIHRKRENLYLGFASLARLDYSNHQNPKKIDEMCKNEIENLEKIKDNQSIIGMEEYSDRTWKLAKVQRLWYCCFWKLLSFFFFFSFFLLRWHQNKGHLQWWSLGWATVLSAKTKSGIFIDCYQYHQ